ncbi:MAG: uracil-DNA glycosylase family protein [Myxococcota bacterium]
MPRNSQPAHEILAASRELSNALEKLKFAAPITHVYNPLVYAWKPYQQYVERYGSSRKRVVVIGMNPGPFGMAQTGVPFGEVSLVRDWLGIHADVGHPRHEHPKRPVQGFDCPRSEVSGARIWGAIKDHFKTPERFFKDHFIANYCPLLFLEESGRNFTPDKLPRAQLVEMKELCNRHLRRVVEILEPQWVVGVGAFAEGAARDSVQGLDVKVGRILHPSPASPRANADWAGQARAELRAQGVCA